MQDQFWQCERCTFHNRVDRRKCQMCEHIQLQHNETHHTNTKEWKCTRCTLENASDATKCALCHADNPSNANQSNSPNIRNLFSSITQQMTEMSGITEQFKQLNEAKQQHEDVSDTECDIYDCVSLKTLSMNMKTYYQLTATTQANEPMHIRSILNSFHHLLLHHDNSNDFHVIYTSCGGICNIKKCISLTRNYRNRDRCKYSGELYGILKDQIEEDEKMKIMLDCEIMDKIHCYYRHSYDIGYRLEPHQSRLIHTNINDKSRNHPNTLFFSSKYGKIKQLLSNKHNTYIRNIRNLTHNKFVSNYNKSMNCDDKKQQHASAVDKMYSFGYEFEYDSNKHDHDKYEQEDYYVGYVKNKYNTFKEELLNHKDVQLNIDQFKHELQKAAAHYGSAYYKKVSKAYDLFFKKTDYKYKYVGEERKKHDFSTEHILSVMIYCNYDVLQYVFSTTYRSNQGMIYLNRSEIKKCVKERHSEFYFLGKYLKETIHSFGILVDVGTIKRFYHGINQQLLFPVMAHTQNVFIPLSTTSSFPVACNFSEESDGLVVEFSALIGSNQFFSCCWLSDFPNEKEHLFIQNSAMLLMDDILFVSDIKGGDVLQFGDMFKATRMLNDLFYYNMDGNPSHSDYPVFPIAAEYKELIVKLIENELGIKKCHLLHSYAEKSFHQFCINQKELTNIAWESMKGKNSFLFKFYCLYDFEWIDLKKIYRLYPNIERIEVWEIKLCSSTFDTILKYIHENGNSIKLKTIEIKSPNKVTAAGLVWSGIQNAVGSMLTFVSDTRSNITNYMSIDDAIQKYKILFYSVGWNMYKHEKYEWLIMKQR